MSLPARSGGVPLWLLYLIGIVTFITLAALMYLAQDANPGLS